MSLKKLLEVRKTLKSRKPDFVREGFHKKKATEKNWRKPQGVRNKVRLNRRGRKKMPNKGYRSPVMVRGLTKDGFKITPVSNIPELKKINPEQEVALISSQVGLRKRAEMLKIAKEMKVTIYNYKDAEKSINSKLKALQDKKKKEKTLEEKVKKAEKKTAEQKAEKEEKEKKTAEEKPDKAKEETEKEKEKKEKDKVLIKPR